MSFACTIVLVMLCMTEIGHYMSVQTKSDMLVDISHHDDRLNINIDLEFPKIPCDVLSLDVQDVMGTHTVDIAGSTVSRRRSSRSRAATSRATSKSTESPVTSTSLRMPTRTS